MWPLAPIHNQICDLQKKLLTFSSCKQTSLGGIELYGLKFETFELYSQERHQPCNANNFNVEQLNSTPLTSTVLNCTKWNAFFPL